MTDFIITCLLIGLGFAVIIVSLVKSITKIDDKTAKHNDLDDITNPSRSWHPLNMWNDD
jgi:hypothetical protein